MVNREEQYTLIEQYLQNKLTPDEQKAFEARLYSDHELRNQVLFHRELHGAISDDDVTGFRSLVKEVDQSYFEGKSDIPISHARKSYYWAAAAVALLILAGVGLWSTNKNNSDSQQLFVSYFEPYDVPGNLRSGDSVQVASHFHQALALYREGHYSQAIPEFTNAIEKRPDHMMAIFLRGVSYLSIDSTQLAKTDFANVINDNKNLFVEQARWYSAMTYLRENKKLRAIEILEHLAKNKPGSNADKLLQKLKR